MASSQILCQKFCIGICTGVVIMLLISRLMSAPVERANRYVYKYPALQISPEMFASDDEPVIAAERSASAPNNTSPPAPFSSPPSSSPPPSNLGEFDITFTEPHGETPSSAESNQSNQSNQSDQSDQSDQSNQSVPTPGLLHNITLQLDIDKKLYKFEMEPIKFLPNYKNPCWFEPLPDDADPYSHNVFPKLMRSVRSTFARMNSIFWKRRAASSESWRLRCLPYFYIPGISKCGTTDLYAALDEHPDVASAPLKEPVYWNRIRWNTTQAGIGWLPKVMPNIEDILTPRPFRDYVDLFDRAAEEIRTRTREQGVNSEGSVSYHYAITGDGTPSYFYDFDGWTKIPVNEGLDEPKYTIADTIHQLTANAKIILIFRNPCDRLFSDYKYFGGRALLPEGRSVDDFHERAVIALDTMRGCLANRTARSCVYDRKLTGQSMPLRIRVGMYLPFLEDWLKVFPRENIFITRLEDYAADRTVVLNRLFAFLGLKPLVSGQENVKVKNKSSDHPSLAGGMREDTRKLITDFYAKWNEKLADRLQDDRFLWTS